MPRLIIVKGSQTGDAYELKPGQPFRIGRRSTNDLAFDDKTLSREHCEITYDGEKVRLCDLGSRHGTYVNGQRVEEAVLADGDIISVGKQTIMYQAKPDEEGAAGAAHAPDPEAAMETVPEAYSPASEQGPRSSGTSQAVTADDIPTGAGQVALVKRDEAPREAAEEPAEAVPAEDAGANPRMRLWITAGAIVVVFLVITALGLVLRGNKTKKQPVLLPIKKHGALEITCLEVKRIVGLSRTYFTSITLGIKNTSKKNVELRSHDFYLLDSAGGKSSPEDAVTKTDLSDISIPPGGEATRSLIFYLRSSVSPAKIVYKNRWWIPLE